MVWLSTIPLPVSHHESQLRVEIDRRKRRTNDNGGKIDRRYASFDEFSVLVVDGCAIQREVPPLQLYE